MDPNTIYKKVENHVVDLYQKNPNPNLHYHNLQHTKNVVKKAKEIAGHYNLSDKEMLVVYVAAWFHDTGYLFSEPPLHEEKSAELMRKYMSNIEEDDRVNEIAECILA